MKKVSEKIQASLIIKDALTLLCWISIIFTIIAIIGVFLSTHNIFYVKFFSNYYAVQSSVSLTMFLLATKFYFFENIKIKKFVYSLICLSLSIVSIFFMILNVY